MEAIQEVLIIRNFWSSGFFTRITFQRNGFEWLLFFYWSSAENGEQAKERSLYSSLILRRPRSFAVFSLSLSPYPVWCTLCEVGSMTSEHLLYGKSQLITTRVTRVLSLIRLLAKGRFLSYVSNFYAKERCLIPDELNLVLVLRWISRNKRWDSGFGALAVGFARNSLQDFRRWISNSKRGLAKLKKIEENDVNSQLTLRTSWGRKCLKTPWFA